MVERLFLAVPRGCLQFVIVVFPDHTHLLFFIGLHNFSGADLSGKLLGSTRTLGQMLTWPFMKMIQL